MNKHKKLSLFMACIMVVICMSFILSGCSSNTSEQGYQDYGELTNICQITMRTFYRNELGTYYKEDIDKVILYDNGKVELYVNNPKHLIITSIENVIIYMDKN